MTAPVKEHKCVKDVPADQRCGMFWLAELADLYEFHMTDEQRVKVFKKQESNEQH